MKVNNILTHLKLKKGFGFTYEKLACDLTSWFKVYRSHLPGLFVLILYIHPMINDPLLDPGSSEAR